MARYGVRTVAVREPKTTSVGYPRETENPFIRTPDKVVRFARNWLWTDKPTRNVVPETNQTAFFSALTPHDEPGVP
jgi:hypothetical protein